MIKKAIDLVKPFFITVCSERMDSETQKLLHAFKADTTTQKALEFYLFD